MVINYKRISDAIEHYNSYGYKNVEVPWIVSRDSVLATLPDWAVPHGLDNGTEALVGSAEQAFIELYMQGRLPLGKFQTTTPCFRYDQLTHLHSRHFMKTELIDTENTTPESLHAMITAAIRFFQSSGGAIPTVAQLEKDECYDINIENVEVGSYGIRSYRGLTWVYGTGLAEPRFTKALAMASEIVKNGLPR